MIRRLPGLAAAMLTAAGLAALPSGPASAAACPSAGGVTVVVEPNELGGGTQVVCDVDGGGQTAATLFTRNGFPLDYVQRHPGFVCRVSGQPADDPCHDTPPADAYWGLWWSDGESGTWTYSSTAAGSLRVPEGGYVAFAWDGSSGSVRPATPARAHPEAPSPSPSSGSGTGGGQPGGGSGGGSGNGGGDTAGPGGAPASSGTPGTSTGAPAPPAESSEPSASGAPGPGRSHRARPARRDRAEDSRGDRRGREGGSSDPGTAAAEPSPSASSQPTSDTKPVADSAQPDDGGLPPWVGPALVGVLFAAAGGTALVRRRRTSAP